MRWLVFILFVLFSAGNAQAQSCSGTPNANTICSGPSSGGSGFPSFRSMVTADITPAGTLPNPFSAGTSLYPISNGFEYDTNSAFVANTLGAKNIVAGTPAATSSCCTWLNTYLSGVDSTGLVTIYGISPAGSVTGWASVFASRTSDNSGAAMNIIPNSNVVVHDHTSTAHLTWSGYDATYITATAATSHHIGREISVFNNGSACGSEDPFTVNPTASCVGLRYDCAKSGSLGGNDCGAAIDIVNNGAKNISGIIVADTSLDTSTNANPDAIALSNPYSITWYNAAAAKTWQMFAGSGANGNLNLNTAGSGSFSVTGGESVSGALSAGSISTSGTLGAGATTVTSLTESTGLAYNTSFTPVLSCGTGTITTSTPTARYRQLGKTIHILMNLAITTLGTCATTISATLPFTAGTIGSVGSGRDTGVSGKMLSATVNPGTASVQIFNYDNSFPAASSANFIISIAYERN